jgi:hypothetical protein
MIDYKCWGIGQILGLVSIISRNMSKMLKKSIRPLIFLPKRKIHNNLGIAYPIIALVTAILLAPAIAFATSAKPTAEEVIEQVFLSDTRFPGTSDKDYENLMRVKTGVLQWLGSYQSVRKDNNRSVILFERGSVPVTVKFAKNGQPKSVAANCPITSVPLSQAPSEFRKPLAKSCPNLQP